MAAISFCLCERTRNMMSDGSSQRTVQQVADVRSLEVSQALLGLGCALPLTVSTSAAAPPSSTADPVPLPRWPSPQKL